MNVLNIFNLGRVPLGLLVPYFSLHSCLVVNASYSQPKNLITDFLLPLLHRVKYCSVGKNEEPNQIL